LKHRAPVGDIQVIDQNMQPLPHDVAKPTAEMTSAFNADQNHKVIICSEEQFKVFQLPTLKPVCKFKLTAVEGARVRRIGYNCYISRQDPNYNEYCLSCLSNLGDLSVYSLPQLKRQVQIQCMKQQDINAITSFVFTKYGQAFYLQSPSEFVQISMSARDTPQLLNIQKTNPATISNTTPTSNSESASNKKSTSHSVASKENSKKTPPLVQTSSTPIASASTTSPPVPLPRSSISKDEGNKSVVESPRSVSGSVSSPSKHNGLSDNVDSQGKNDASGSKSSTSTKHSNGHLNDLSMKTSSPIKREIDTAHNLNQSTISAINTHNSDSFNANSSGICSITTTSNTTSLSIQNGVDLSLDSVVDRFQEDMHDVSTKKIPSSIEEDNSTSNQNDSVLNISEVSADMNQKLTLNGSTSAKKIANGVSKTNGHHSGNTSTSSENGHLENGHMENGHSHSQNGN